MSMMHTFTPREKKNKDWRHNDRPNKPRSASPHATHTCESCGMKLSRKGVYVVGYTMWCTSCGHTLKKQYMSEKFLAQVVQFTES